MISYRCPVDGCAWETSVPGDRYEEGEGYIVAPIVPLRVVQLEIEAHLETHPAEDLRRMLTD